jgi:hypothetical protein
MEPQKTQQEPQKKKSFLGFLAWWKTDPVEIERQVALYSTLKIHHSARGISLLLCGFSVAVTLLLGKLIGLSAFETGVEVVTWGSLGAAMYRGHRWAFVTAIVLWTLEKGYMLFAGVAAGGAPIVQVIWWAVYMNAFFQGYKVEAVRKAVVTAPAA